MSHFRSKKLPNLHARIISNDQIWVYKFKAETSKQSPEWGLKNETECKNTWENCSEVLQMFSYNFRRVVHFDYLLSDQTMNKEYYLSILKHLRNAILCKRLQLRSNNSWIFIDDNVLSPQAWILSNYTYKHQINNIEQSPYLPDLSLSNFFFFLKLKITS